MNQEELNKQIEEHNIWHEDNGSGRQLQLKDVILSQLCLPNVRLMGATFERVSFDRCVLRSAAFSRVQMASVSFVDTDLSEASFFEGRLHDIEFKKCKMIGASLSGVIGDSCNFSGIKLDSAAFPKSIFNRTSFASASLKKANMLKFVLNGGNFSHSDLSGTNLTKAEFIDVDLRGAIFRDAELLKTHFKRVRAYGITGPVQPIKKCYVTEPDFSEKGDGSKIGTQDEFVSLLQRPTVIGGISMDLSESMIRYYLDSVTLSYFNHNELPPDDVNGYSDQVLAMKRKAVSHGDLDFLKVAFEYLLSHREFDCRRLGDERYPYSDGEIREIIRYAWHTIWPETVGEEPAAHQNVRLVLMPLEDWWKTRRGTSGEASSI